MQKHLVSVRLMVYNNSPYIREAIESVLNQKTNFKVEIVIGDDFSTDGTLEIIESYKKTDNIYLNVLKRDRGGVYWQERRRMGRLYNFMDIINHCESKYIALLDGDDYWTDPFKLQKQVDFLESNPDVSVCFHKVLTLKNNKMTSQKIPVEYVESTFSYLELLKTNNFIVSASVLFKKPNSFVFPKWFTNIPFGDLALYKLVSQFGKFYCINEEMAVYRIHDQGIYSGITKLKARKNYLKFYELIYPHLNREEKAVSKSKMQALSMEIGRLRFPKVLVYNKIYAYFTLITAIFKRNFNIIY